MHWATRIGVAATWLRHPRLFRESLRLRRTLNDPRGLIRSLRTAGTWLAKRAGSKEALKLHREALELAVLDDMRLRVLLDLSSITRRSRTLAAPSRPAARRWN